MQLWTVVLIILIRLSLRLESKFTDQHYFEDPPANKVMIQCDFVFLYIASSRDTRL